ncbi:iron chelate uptake ABC transporter family permease subunit [Proteus mirabilis]
MGYFSWSLHVVNSAFCFCRRAYHCCFSLFYCQIGETTDPVLSLVLVGIAISALCGSAISLMKILADPYTQLPSITFWLLGGYQLSRRLIYSLLHL